MLFKGVNNLCNLRRLALESCSLSTLNFEGDDDRSPLACLSETLLTLNLSDNELDDPGAVRPALASLCGTLVELDLRENDLREEMGTKAYTKLMLTDIFPNTTGAGAQLCKLDNKHTGRDAAATAAAAARRGGGGMVMPLSQLEGIAEAVGGEDEVVAANEDRGSCSCLEGNACVEKFCCKDWKNRFKIARAVRKMKGMASLPGD